MNYTAGASCITTRQDPPPGERSRDRSNIGSKRNTGGGRERRDPRRAGADLGGGGDGGEDPGPDEVGEEAGEGEQEGVVHRHEQRRGPVPPLPRRSGAELLGRLHRALPAPLSFDSGDLVRLPTAFLMLGVVGRWMSGSRDGAVNDDGALSRATYISCRKVTKETNGACGLMDKASDF